MVEDGKNIFGRMAEWMSEKFPQMDRTGSTAKSRTRRNCWGGGTINRQQTWDGFSLGDNHKSNATLVLTHSPLLDLWQFWPHILGHNHNFCEWDGQIHCEFGSCLVINTGRITQGYKIREQAGGLATFSSLINALELIHVRRWGMLCTLQKNSSE